MSCAEKRESQVLRRMSDIFETLIVRTTYGSVEGERGDGVSVWRGIPYAAPPVGELRFRKPQPPGPWEGARDATEFGHACPQGSRMKGRAPVTDISEDCLTINIWSPASDRAKRAVLFYIHGGSFSEGTGADKEYEGTKLAREGDVVVVTFNYRLGAFGFMNFSFLDERFTPNCGLWDCLAALRWVNENIAAFGGDPDNVTVCGQSAGATIACVLSLYEGARGYMQRVIMMSGVTTLLHTETQAQQIAREFLDFMGIPDAASLLALEGKALAILQRDFSVAGYGAIAFGPSLDHEIIKQYPIKAARESETPGVPMLIGTTREEMSIALNPFLSGIVDINKIRREGVAVEGEEKIAQIKKVYSHIYGKRGQAINISDYVFRIPSVWFAEARSGNSNTWMYRFDYETFGMRISRMHAFHSSDIPFLFGNFKSGHAKLMTLLSSKKSVMKLHKELRGDFLTLMKEGVLPWEPCTEEAAPAKCYAHHSKIEPAVPAEIMKAYEGTDFMQRCLAGESVAIR